MQVCCVFSVFWKPVANFAQNDWCITYALVLLRGSDHRFYERARQAFVKVSDQRLRARHDRVICNVRILGTEARC